MDIMELKSRMYKIKFDQVGLRIDWTVQKKLSEEAI